MKALVQWLKENVWGTLIAFLGGMAVIFGMSFLLKQKPRRIRDEGRISMVKGMVRSFQDRSVALELLNKRDAKQVARLDLEREKLRKEIRDARSVAGMSDQEALEAFRRLGY